MNNLTTEKAFKMSIKIIIMIIMLYKFHGLSVENTLLSYPYVYLLWFKQKPFIHNKQ